MNISKYILIATVGFFFMLSACEVSTKYFINNFGDEYDYYVHSDTQSQSPIVKIILHFDILPVEPIYLSENTGCFYSERILQNIQLYSPPKLFLKYSLLII